MNQFSIFGEVGKSRVATVYKGRRKGTIDFHALKSVEKGERERILVEVSFIHHLRHPHIIRFHEWFETRNHLWLILEYCTGGNLMELLLQDLVVPEASVRDFGTQLVVALQYLHHNGIIYGNLKPGTVLIDDLSRLKLSDFSLASRVEDDDATVQQRTRRLTPVYTAPELFADGARPTFASDLWALGCVLYELAAGRPPFVSSNFRELLDLILNKEPSPLTTRCSPELKDLLDRLLIKDPSKRIKWSQLVLHPFFAVKFPPLPVNDVYKDSSEVGSSSTPPSPSEKPENLKNSVNGKQDISKSSGRSSNGFDLAQMSVALEEGARTEETGLDRRGLESTMKREGLQAALNAAEEIELQTSQAAEAADVESVEEADAGMDEGETYEDDFEEADDGIAMAPVEQGALGQEIRGVRQFAVGPSAQQQNEDAGEHRPLSAPLVMPIKQSGLHAQPSEGSSNRPSTTAASNSNQTVQTGQQTQAGAMPTNELLWHSSDTQVRPIVGNPRIEKVPVLKPDEQFLGLPKVSALKNGDDMQAVEHALFSIDSMLKGKAVASAKLNALAYLEHAMVIQGVADSILESEMIETLGQTVRKAKSVQLRIRALHAIGLSFRHAGDVQQAAVDSCAVQSALDTLRGGSNEVSMRRRAIALIGELIFFAASQQEEQANIGGTEIEDRAQLVPLKLPSGMLTLVMRCLRQGEDSVVQGYAVQTLDNVFAGESKYVKRLLDSDTPFLLLHLADAGPTELVRTTAASALARLTRSAPTLSSPLIERIGLSTLVNIIRGAQPRAAQAFLSILGCALSDDGPSPKVLRALGDGKEICTALTKNVAQTSGALRAKAIVCCSALSALHPKWCQQLLSCRLASGLEKASTDQEPYVAHALVSLRSVLSSLAQPLLEAILSADQVKHDSSKQQGSGPSEFSGLLMQLASSASTRACVATPKVLELLARGLSSPSSSIKKTVLHVLEALSGQATALDMNELANRLIPALGAGMGNDSGIEIQALSARVVSDFMRALAPIMTQTGEPSDSLCNAAARYIIPRCRSLLADRDPLPSLALRALAAIVGDLPHLSAALPRMGIIPRLVALLSPSNPLCNSNLLVIVRSLTECPDVDPAYLVGLGLASALPPVLNQCLAEGEEADAEPAVDAAAALLYHAAKTVQEGGAANAEISGLVVLHESAAALAQGLGSYDEAFAEKAGYCLLLLARLYGGQGVPKDCASGLAAGLSSDFVTVQKRALKTIVWLKMAGGEAFDPFWELEEIRVCVEQLAQSQEPSVCQLAADILS